jgi:hypothetical protein
MSYPAKRGPNAAVCPASTPEEAAAHTCHATHHLLGGQPHWPRVHRTPTMEAANAPQRGPAPQRRSCRRRALQHAKEVEVAATRRRSSSIESSAKSVLVRPRSDHPGHGSVTRANEDAACSREPTKPPATGRSAWGKGNGVPPPRVAQAR